MRRYRNLATYRDDRAIVQDRYQCGAYFWPPRIRFNGGQNQHDARTALALPAVLRHPEPMPQVLNIRHLPGFKERQPIIPPGAVYIGRRNARYRLPVSKWGNPFSIKREADRAEAIAAYERWLQSQRPLMEALHELSGLDLVCWCAPLPCHGDVLLRLANE